MKTKDILDLVEHNTFIGEMTRLDYKNMYIISYKNPLPTLSPHALNQKQRILLRDLSEYFVGNIFELPCYAIFSYKTLVAYIIYDNEHRHIALLRTTKWYSRTTSKQLTQLDRALDNQRLSCDYIIEDYSVDFSILDN